MIEKTVTVDIKREFKIVVTFRVCAECGLPFVLDDQRQRFCPAEGGASESQCGRKNRMRRLRSER